MIQDTTGLIHTIAAFMALVTGAVIFFTPKAGKVHKTIGYIYVASMVIVNVTAFMLYRLTGSFNILHIAAIVSCIPLTLGMRAVFLRHKNDAWFFSHYENMCWSYIGLFAAFLAETSVRVVAPYIVNNSGFSIGWWFWSIVGISTFIVCLIGKSLVNRNLKAMEAYK